MSVDGRDGQHYTGANSTVSGEVRMEDHEAGTTLPDGLYTSGGGDVIRPGSGTTCGSSGDVRNQTLLVFDRSVLPQLSVSEARELALIQLRFAQAVSEQAAAAYARMITLLEVKTPA